MDALLTIARSIRRAFSPAPEIPARSALRVPEVQDADAMLEAVDALRLDAFRRQMRRYTRPELAQLGADLADSDVAAIREAAAMTVEQFTEWSAVRAARAAQADAAHAQSTAAAAAMATLATRLPALVPTILHRAARSALRPLILTQRH